MAPKHLVVQHLENVQAGMLEEYQALIRDFIHGKHGVYALYSGEDLYYVGLASNMRRRLKNHLRDGHQGHWDRFSVYITHNDQHMRELEALVLRIVKPTGNRQTGKLAGSTNIKRQLAADLKRQQEKLRNDLLGRQPKKKKITRKIPKKTTEKPAVLSQYITRRFSLRATYKGKTYRAHVKKNGWILYDGYLYSSPSAAGRDAVGHNINGWHLWMYQRSPGEWVRLGQLRRK